MMGTRIVALAAMAAAAVAPPVAAQPVATDPYVTEYLRLLGTACPARPVDGWLPAKADRWDQENPKDYVAGFDDRYRALYKVVPQAAQGHFAASYRDCLARAEAGVRTSRRALTLPQRRGNCADCSILMSPLALQGPRLRLLQGLTHLLPETLGEQDWTKAAETIRSGALGISATQQRYAAVASAANDQRIAKREAARDRAMIFGAILSGVTAGVTNDRTVIDRTMQAFQAGQQEFDQRIATMRNDSGALFRAPGNRTISDDGIRVTVPRIQAGSMRSGPSGPVVSYGVLGAIEMAFPLNPIVQVVRPTGRCTGSFIGPRLVLTNRHCVVDANGRRSPSITLEWRYFADAYAGERIDPGIGEKGYQWGVTNVVYPTRDHEADWSADWALIETDRPSTVGYLNLRRPDTVPDFRTARVAIAGFSGDLNDGRYVTMDWGCPVQFDSRPNVLTYSCRTFPGSSGSPVIVVDRPGLRRYVVGVNSRGYKDTAAGWKYAAVDPEMFRIAADMRAKQIAQSPPVSGLR